MGRGLRWTQEQLEARLAAGKPPAQSWPTPDSRFQCECGNPEPHTHHAPIAGTSIERIASAKALKDAESPNGQLAHQCASAGILYSREVEFHPVRNWRLDFVFPNPHSMLALEINGGLFVEGRHTQGAALLREYEKLSEAAIAGYRVLFVTPEDVKKGRALALIRRALKHPLNTQEDDHDVRSRRQWADHRPPRERQGAGTQGRERPGDADRQRGDQGEDR